MVAGLTLTSASSVAHDLYATVWKRGQASEKDEVRVARIAAFVIGGIAIVLAIPAQKLNIAFLVALAFAVAASANLPSLVYNLFWRRFNTRGAVWAIYGGLIVCVGLVFFSPVVSGTPTSLFADSDWQWFPLSNPGIISIPAGFLFGLPRDHHQQGAGGRGQVHRAGGPRAHRRGLGAGDLALSLLGGGRGVPETVQRGAVSGTHPFPQGTPFPQGDPCHHRHLKSTASSGERATAVRGCREHPGPSCVPCGQAGTFHLPQHRNRP